MCIRDRPCTLDLPDLHGQIAEVIRSGVPVIRRAGQENRHYLMQISPYVDRSGQRTGAVLTFTDVSELRRAEIEREQAEERFRLFMDNSPAIAWIKDAEGRHLYLSQTYERRFGVSQADWLGKTDFEIWPAEIAEALRKHDLVALATGRPIEVLEEKPNADGERSYWHKDVYKRQAPAFPHKGDGAFRNNGLPAPPPLVGGSWRRESERLHRVGSLGSNSRVIWK